MKKSKNKILIVGGSFPLPFGGGSINYVYNLLEGLKGYDCTILTANAEEENNKEFDRNYFFKVIRSRYIISVLSKVKYSYARTFLNIMLANIIIVCTAIKLRPKVLYYMEYSYSAMAAILIHAILRSKIGVFTYAEEITQLRGRMVHDFLFKQLFSMSSVIYTVSDYTTSLVCEYGDFEDKIVKIIPPVRVDVDATGKIILDNKNSVVKILTVARLEERKGHLFVIDSIVHLHKLFPNIEYNIVGVGSYEEVIRAKIDELQANDYIHLLGKLSNSDLNSIYRNSDIFVMAHFELENGDTEGCPTVFLEASYYKLPVVGGKAGGVNDAIINNETGYIVDVYSDGLYEAIKRLIKSPEMRASMGEKGYNYAKRFSTVRQGEKLRDATDGLLL